MYTVNGDNLVHICHIYANTSYKMLDAHGLASNRREKV